MGGVRHQDTWIAQSTIQTAAMEGGFVCCGPILRTFYVRVYPHHGLRDDGLPLITYHSLTRAY
jgi:hypothetical protein